MGLFRHRESGERVHVPDGSSHPGTRDEHKRLTDSLDWERIGDDYEPAGSEPATTPAPAAAAAGTGDKPPRR